MRVSQQKKKERASDVTRDPVMDAMDTSSSSATAGESDSELLDKVFFRVVGADGDAALTSALAKYLPVVLVRLSSGQEGVRKKVMELLVHINKRVKDNRNVKLPVEGLLELYRDPAATTFVTNFAIIYLKMGFPRLEVDHQARLIPSLLAAMEGKPAPHQDSLLLLALPVLDQIKVKESEKKTFLGLSERPAVAKLFNQFLLDYLLLPYGAHPSIKPAEGEDPGPKTPAGLSEEVLDKSVLIQQSCVTFVFCRVGKGCPASLSRRRRTSRSTSAASCASSASAS